MVKYVANYLNKKTLTDHAQIERAKLINAKNVARYFLLGDFDNEGNYSVSDELRMELILMKKFIRESYDDLELCHGRITLNRPIAFVVTYGEDKATLSLLEEMPFLFDIASKDGNFSMVNELVLDELAVNENTTKDYIYRHWNITEFDPLLIDINDLEEEEKLEYPALIQKYKYLLSTNLKIAEKSDETEKLDKKYLIDINGVLEDYPELKKYVGSVVKNVFAGGGEEFNLDSPYFISTLNLVIDKAIESYIGEKTEEFAEFNVDRHNIDNEYNIKMSDILSIEKPFTQTALHPVMFETSLLLKHSLLSDLRSAWEEKKQTLTSKKAKEVVNLILKGVGGLNDVLHIYPEAKNNLSDDVLAQIAKIQAQNKVTAVPKSTSAVASKEASKGVSGSSSSASKAGGEVKKSNGGSGVKKDKKKAESAKTTSGTTSATKTSGATSFNTTSATNYINRNDDSRGIKTFYTKKFEFVIGAKTTTNVGHQQQREPDKRPDAQGFVKPNEIEIMIKLNEASNDKGKNNENESLNGKTDYKGVKDPKHPEDTSEINLGLGKEAFGEI